MPFNDPSKTDHPWAGREIGIVSPEMMKEKDGLEIMIAIHDGTFPVPPITRLLGYGAIEFSPGKAVFAGTPRYEHYNPFGAVHGGFAATLLDTCMACAIGTLLKKGQWQTTLELSVNYVRPLTAETGQVTAEGTALYVSKRVATAEGRIVDGQGKLCAHGTTTCLVMAL